LTQNFTFIKTRNPQLLIIYFSFNIANKIKFMSHHQEHHPTGVIRNFSITAGLSFAIIFLLFVAFSGCHGNFQPKSAESHSKSSHNTEEPSGKH
jgi:hypothetical protein